MTRHCGDAANCVHLTPPLTFLPLYTTRHSAPTPLKKTTLSPPYWPLQAAMESQPVHLHPSAEATNAYSMCHEIVNSVFRVIICETLELSREGVLIVLHYCAIKV